VLALRVCLNWVAQARQKSPLGLRQSIAYPAPVVEVFEAIRRRRSLKPENLKTDPVDRALLEQLFEAANWAPSHGLTEPWRFVVFQGDARRALVDVVIETMADAGQPPLAPTDPRRISVETKMLRAPVTIAIVCAASSSPKIVEHEEIIATGIAVQNLHLAATALGLAGYWTSGKKAFHPKMAEFLGIAPPHRCLGFFYLGHPVGELPEGSRKPWQEKVAWKG
jgi:nitroreductase